MINKISKSDFKNGMVAELNNGKKVQILLDTEKGDIFTGESWGILDCLIEYTNYNDKEYGIKKLYAPTNNFSYGSFITYYDEEHLLELKLDLVWEWIPKWKRVDKEDENKLSNIPTDKLLEEIKRRTENIQF